MNKKIITALSLSTLLLAGCQASTTVPESSEKLMTIGSKTYTKGDQYTIIKESSGPNLVMNEVNKMIANKEVGVTDEIKKEAQNMLKLYDTGESFEKQIKLNGYTSREEYLNDVLIPAAQAKKMTENYFKEAKEEIETEFRPVLGVVIQTDSEDNASKALEALKKGENPGKVGAQYGAKGSSYTGSEQIFTTANKALPDKLLNALLDAGKTGVLDEVYKNDTSTDNVQYYVGSVVSTNYEDNLQKIIDALSSNQTIVKNRQVFYLKKYDFTVHDQYLFDYYKATNPEYLVTRPDLAPETKDSQS